MRFAGRLTIPTCLFLLAAPIAALAETPQGQQELVDRAALAAQEILDDQQGHDARGLLPQARAVMICPRVFRAGFLFGGEGGGCVLLARGGQGSWSSPALYSMDSQFRLGANASVALVTLGGGVEGATTTNLNADIVAFARTRGLFAGVSLQGSVMSSDSAGDQLYYGQPVGPVDIVMAMRANNPAADPLRSVLMRYGAQAPAPLPPPVAANGYYAPPVAANGYYPPPSAPPVGYAAAPAGPVEQQSLPPPR
jgi:lipid-binding SYLF domain-containing protein